MRTSLNEIKAIEDHLFNNTKPAESLLFQARMILDADLRENVAVQQRVYQMVQEYSRKHLKTEIEAVHQKLMDQPQSFMRSVLALFTKP